LAEVEVQGATVATALEIYCPLPNCANTSLTARRAFVNLSLSVRCHHLQGVHTPSNRATTDDQPSVAGAWTGLTMGSAHQPGCDHPAVPFSFILNLPWLAALVALAMMIGTVLAVPAFGFVYRRVLRPLGMVKPDVQEDNPESHRFAQGFGSVVLLVGILALFGGAWVLGWSLVWLVIALAALNLFAGFCAGCAVYYWLARLQVPGFSKSAPQGRFLGMRPRN
jgi:hypothetical protein